MQMNWQPVDVVAVTEKVLAAQRAYAKDHSLVMDFPPDFPAVEADPDKLDQILTNLVNNAIKYSPQGGTVRAVGRVLGDPAHGAPPPSVVLRVSDEGMGISREHQHKIFDKFYRVDNRDNREIGGTGIGLALVKALVEDGHRGKVTVDSEPGKGTTFTVVLPLRRAPH